MPATRAPDHRRGPPPLPKKSSPGQPWSHQETIALIDAYRDKWYALKRGQLKAQQWEEVADAIAARCGLYEAPKTGTQCRHKVEKLRKRYRSERTGPSPSPWPYFDRMDRMERGQLQISSRPLSLPCDGSSDEDEDEEVERGGGNVRSINGILRDGNWGCSRVSREPRLPRRGFEVEVEAEAEAEEDEEEDDGAEVGDQRGAVMSELAAVVRRFGEGMMRIEKRRMEVMREAERDWMEMETKRTEMVMESQRWLVDRIAGSLESQKKAKKSHENV